LGVLLYAVFSGGKDGIRDVALWLVRLGSAIGEDELRDARAHARCSVAVAPCESLFANQAKQNIRTENTGDAQAVQRRCPLPCAF
jgi:hypothetical protein